ncbi:hypothetical protein [Moraxella lacunata]
MGFKNLIKIYHIYQLYAMLDCLKFTNFGQILNVNEQSFLFLAVWVYGN